MAENAERVKRELSDRLRRFVAGDRGAVTDTVGSEFALAAGTQAGGEDYVEVVTLLGRLRLCREGLLGPGGPLPDLREVALALAPACRDAPQSFPTLLLVTVEAIAGLPQYDKPERLIGKAVNLMNHGVARGDASVLREAVDLYGQALAAAALITPTRGDLLANICSCWITVFGLTGDLAAVEEAVRAGGESVANVALTQHRGTAVNNLGCALRLRYDQTGRRADLDVAIELFHEAIAATAREDVEWPVRNHNLGYALALRHHAEGRGEDLDRAISLVGLAVDAVGAHRPQRAEYLADLSQFHWIRYELTRDRADATAAARLLSLIVDTAEDRALRERAAGLLAVVENASG